jgi:hypothetical protein
MELREERVWRLPSRKGQPSCSEAQRHVKLWMMGVLYRGREVAGQELRGGG